MKLIKSNALTITFNILTIINCIALCTYNDDLLSLSVLTFLLVGLFAFAKYLFKKIER